MSTNPPNTIWVITGANRGIGLGLLKRLLERPSTTVIATVRNNEAASTLNAEVASLSPRKDNALHIIQLDFTTALAPEAIRSAFEAALPNLSHIDILINNAALAPPLIPSVTITADSLRASFEVNTIAPLLTFQALWPYLKNSPLVSKPPAGPKLITITSALGCINNMLPYPAGAYGPSKAAANWLTKSLHVQLADEGLIAAAVHPGWTQTNMGHFAAGEWGIEEGPPVTVEQSVEGILEAVDKVDRDSGAGRLLSFDGDKMEW
ncbi:hypothetical protein BDV18DRAFT_163135 [Aspergillus unguis]